MQNSTAPKTHLKSSQTLSNTKSTLFYLPNLIGYLRLFLLLLSLFLSPRLFLLFYATSYLLDALDGYLARAYHQESQLGYILDMALDRASSTVLSLHIAAKRPALLPFVSTIVVLDLVSHLFCVAVSLQSKKSHKDHTSSPDSFSTRILSLYYNRTTLFLICFATEAFMLSLLFSHSLLITLLLTPPFLFKQLTNILQLHQALHWCSLH
ncbi:CDP-diacylglycerol--inositol 3-phosphatidyltransferase [Nematocida homosporus]|uniref:CDP-diacylglycerol--inositol 3-phosphatidyltransferase n=1 Tax=Nematocida homosporus TaxID=1912981 RepID=UPI00221FC779|nr:CDP-diacylglycerol--inositol 3-phosphatidyltransferase [Nematocida homosporus]KAI5187035.1 CDP-diacylglycerol--inositol 3-phosphatidyltransferase [Nematocida homosporus]